jgi:hypothetical protein
MENLGRGWIQTEIEEALTWNEQIIYELLRAPDKTGRYSKERMSGVFVLCSDGKKREHPPSRFALPCNMNSIAINR